MGSGSTTVHVQRSLLLSIRFCRKRPVSWFTMLRIFIYAIMDAVSKSNGAVIQTFRGVLLVVFADVVAPLSTAFLFPLLLLFLFSLLARQRVADYNRGYWLSVRVLEALSLPRKICEFLESAANWSDLRIAHSIHDFRTQIEHTFYIRSKTHMW